jgi:tetratricopeptide (TPR) repeat protein
MTPRFGTMLLRAVLITGLGALGACGGGSKGGTTTPTGTGTTTTTGGTQSMNDKDPTGGGTTNTGGGNSSGTNNTGAGSMPDPNGGGGATAPVEPPIVFPNQDPDPAQAKTQVDAHLNIAKSSLARNPPDADTALHESLEALKFDASSVDAAAYVAFAYYHKKLYDTAELVLDDVFKREAAKSNPNVYYVYGLVYEHTNRPDQAVLAYKKAVELNPNFASALVNLGVFQLRNKQYAEAQSAFERLVQQFNLNDAVTLTSLASAYRGHAADYPPGSADRNQLIMSAEQSYKRALAANGNYGPAYYNLALLYLDFDPFPSGGGSLDTMTRLNAAKTYLDQYAKTPSFELKLYDERTKDVTKAIKRATKKAKGSKPAPAAAPAGAGGGGTP